MRWSVVPIIRSHSRWRSIPALIKRLRPLGCIYDCDGAAENIPQSIFGNAPVVFANTKGASPDAFTARVCVFRRETGMTPALWRKRHNSPYDALP